MGFPQAQTMASFPRAAFDVFDLDEMLTPEERALRHSVRAFAVSTSSHTCAYQVLGKGSAVLNGISLSRSRCNGCNGCASCCIPATHLKDVWNV